MVEIEYFSLAKSKSTHKGVVRGKSGRRGWAVFLCRDGITMFKKLFLFG